MKNYIEKLHRNRFKQSINRTGTQIGLHCVVKNIICWTVAAIEDMEVMPSVYTQHNLGDLLYIIT